MYSLTSSGGKPSTMSWTRTNK